MKQLVNPALPEKVTDQPVIEQWLETIIRRVVREELQTAAHADDQLLTAEQVAEMLGLTDVHSVYRLKREKKLRAIYLGNNSLRFRRADVRQFIEERAR
ncbi:MAG TPA: helix-turn-helix domain-containing protein [Pyrinomonadaceae bacterium]